MMIEKTYATLLFEREYNQTKNRYELEEDFYYEMENFGLVGDFSLTKKELIFLQSFSKPWNQGFSLHQSCCVIFFFECHI